MRAASKASSFRRSPSRTSTAGRFESKGDIMGNPVVHWEFMSKDPAGVSDFYAKIFGWKVTHHQPINYRIVETGAKGAMPGINGGILKPDREGPWPGNMLFYVLVDDLAAYRRKIVEAGGVICGPEHEGSGLGKP